MAASDGEYQADQIRNAVVAMIAKQRLARGVKLNVTEAQALIADFLVEGARDGRTVVDLMDAGAHVLEPHQVMDGVAKMLTEVRAVGSFPDGIFPVIVHNPIRGSSDGMVPGEVIVRDGSIALNAGQPTVTIAVHNTGDRPIQVGSHYHFAEANTALSFDRNQARGMRLDIASGRSVRFEPGQTREVTLVPFSGGKF